MTQTVSSMSLILTGNATSRYTVGQHAQVKLFNIIRDFTSKLTTVDLAVELKPR